MILWCYASFGLIWQFLGVSKSHVNCSGRHAKKNPKKKWNPRPGQRKRSTSQWRTGSSPSPGFLSADSLTKWPFIQCLSNVYPCLSNVFSGLAILGLHWGSSFCWVYVRMELTSLFGRWIASRLKKVMKTHENSLMNVPFHGAVRWSNRKVQGFYGILLLSSAVC